MKISKRQREAAILECLCRADWWTPGRPADGPPTSHVAWAAWAAAYPHHRDMISVWLEAAALLRDGWSPGEPVERIGGPCG